MLLYSRWNLINCNKVVINCILWYILAEDFSEHLLCEGYHISIDLDALETIILAILMLSCITS